MNRTSSIALAVLGVAFGATAAAADGNSEAGRLKSSMCIGCHGIEGYRISFPEVYQVPKLGGQHAAYIVKALHGYKAGSRNNQTMRAIASSLSDQDMADLAAYFGSADVQMAGK